MDGSTIEAESGVPVAHSNIVPRATVRDMVRRREAAIAAFDQAHDALTFAAEAFDGARLAHHSIDLRGKEDSYISLTREEERHFLSALKVPTLTDFTATARKVIDRRMWAVLIELTDLEKIMDKEAKDQLRQSLMDNPPEATEDNIFATIQQFALDADTIFKRGIANCFTKLDRRFRSHDGWKIGARVILSHTFSEYGNWSSYNQRDTLHDIDRTFHVLDGGTTPQLYGGIVAAIDESRRVGGWGKRQSECESEYFRIRCFMNGNCHVWFKRDDLVEKVNKLLGEYYGAPIPEERAAQVDPLSTPKTSLAKRYGFFPTPDATADKFIENAMLRQRDADQRLVVLEPSAGTGNLASRAVKAGAIVDCIEYQGALADQLKRSGRYRNVACADFLTVQPAGRFQMYDRVLMNPPFDRERDIDHVMHALKFLKPDGVLLAIMSAGTEFRETKKATAFRDLMDKMHARWRDLPAGSFSSVGTNVNTIMLRVFKDGSTQPHWW